MRFLSSSGGGAGEALNPHFFSLSIYPRTPKRLFMTSMLKKYSWTSVVGMVDSSSIAGEQASRGMLATFADITASQEIKNFRYTVLTYSSSLGYEEVERVLRQMSKVSRSNVKNI